MRLYIAGQPYSKGNRRIATSSGILPKSPEAQAYERSFLAYSMAAVAELRDMGVCPLHTFVSLSFWVYYRSDLPDLSGELIRDCLERAGFIENDRQNLIWTMEKLYSEENPRVEVVARGIRADYKVVKRD